MSVTSSKPHSEKVTFGEIIGSEILDTCPIAVRKDAYPQQNSFSTPVLSYEKNVGAIQGPGITHCIKEFKWFCLHLFKIVMLFFKLTEANILIFTYRLHSSKCFNSKCERMKIKYFSHIDEQIHKHYTYSCHVLYELLFKSVHVPLILPF